MATKKEEAAFDDFKFAIGQIVTMRVRDGNLTTKTPEGTFTESPDNSTGMVIQRNLVECPEGIARTYTTRTLDGVGPDLYEIELEASV